MLIQREEKKTHQNKPVKMINLAWGTKVQCYCLISLFVARCLENTALLYFTEIFHSFAYNSIRISDYKDSNQRDEDDRDTISSSVRHTSRSSTVFYTIALISLRFLASMSKLPPQQKIIKRSRIIFLYTSVKLSLKVTRNEYCAFPQKNPFVL